MSSPAMPAVLPRAPASDVIDAEFREIVVPDLPAELQQHRLLALRTTRRLAAADFLGVARLRMSTTTRFSARA